MLKKNMYVRCPSDIESMANPRIFISGQVESINEIANEAKVSFKDPYGFRKYYDTFPTEATVPLYALNHCEATKGALVQYDDEPYLVIETTKKETGNYLYYLQKLADKSIEVVSEEKIILPFTEGRISPEQQLMNYELQHPCWYFGRSVVSRTMNILENSIYGFKELAGCKIYLKPHQLKTIMRCLQGKECRYMLADEVGLGKTIEAASVLKVSMNHSTNKNIMIAVPNSLLEQWKVELFVKFDILIGSNKNNNYVDLCAIEELQENQLVEKWDFVIVDEAHRLLSNTEQYRKIYNISVNAENILFLSATPVQQKKVEYLKLLKLISPERYSEMSEDEFQELLDRQNEINTTVYFLLNDLDEYSQIIAKSETNPHENKEILDIYENLCDQLGEIGEVVNNKTFNELKNQVDFYKADCGIRSIQVTVSYICENYQIEKSIIRNRRFFVNELASRKYVEKSYSLDRDINTNETNAYFSLLKWIETSGAENDKFQSDIIPLLAAFFSSPWAFKNSVKETMKKGYIFDNDLLQFVDFWINEEQQYVDDIAKVLQDPDVVNNRIVKVIDYIDQWIVDDKAVVFTNYKETFEVYKKCFIEYFGSEKCAFFNKGMDRDELELEVLRFQKNSECSIMLCDETGGEGRNFQCSDYVVHIDLPWDANAIEQRIGRLDRIGRSSDRDVISVLFYAVETIEEQLFKFWNKGLNIFQQSLSGLEIIMNDINESIISAITTNFKYGLEEKIDEIIEMSQSLEKSVRDEQHFDTAAYKYDAMNIELEKTIEYYNRNENELFTTAMMNWAQLAGLNGSVTSDEDGMSFGVSQFSIGSAKKTILIPPNWEKYLNTQKNLYTNHILELYNELYGDNTRKKSEQFVEGTFSRDEAIKKDNLHFFAPGDDIFECIVDNAMKSCKGQVAAFAALSNIEWRGFVFTWTAKPNEKILLDAGIPLINISHYRNFLEVEQIQVAIPFSQYGEIKEKEVLLEYNRIINLGYDKQEIFHWGKRERGEDPFGLKRDHPELKNIDYFKNRYSDERWRGTVQKATQSARIRGRKKLESHSNLIGIKNEIMKTLSTRIATNKFYGRSEDVNAYERECNLVITAFEQAELSLDAACLIWMVKK